MIAWSTLAPGLRELFSTMATDEVLSVPFAAQWQEGAKEITHPEVGAELALKVTSVANIGLDELRYANVDDDLVESVVGQRRFVLQARVDSHYHGPAVSDDLANELTAWCWTMTERLRTSIRRSRNRAALEALNVALIDIGPASDASFTFSKRRVNAAICDFFLATAFTDTDPVMPGWIERIDLTSLIQGVDGEVLPSPPNIENEKIPPLP